MRPQRKRTRLHAGILVAGVAALALAASAAAAIYVYTNGFATKADFKEVKKASGGSHCDKHYRDQAESMLVSVVGKRLCGFTVPVFGDAPQPNHIVVARGQGARKQTPKNLREGAYFAVRVRQGRGDYYELQVRPAEKRWKLIRKPAEGEVSESGSSNAIRPFKEVNTLLLMAKGAHVIARVNGKKLVEVVDPKPEEVQGRRVLFGLGSRKDSAKPVVGVFDRIKAGIAN